MRDSVPINWACCQGMFILDVEATRMTNIPVVKLLDRGGNSCVGPLQGPLSVCVDHMEVGLLHRGQKLYLPLVLHFQMDWDHVHHDWYDAECGPNYRAHRSPD
jgi:hypothetical protein